METLNQPRQSRQSASAASDPMLQSTSVESGYPFPPTSRYEQDPEVLPSTKGIARAGSTRRRTDGSGQLAGVARPPQAPEVPKGPPLSYRGPYDNDESMPVPQTDKSNSFAARARASQKDTASENGGAVVNGIAATPQQSTSTRRSSVKRPSGTIYDPVEPYTNENLQLSATAARLPQALDIAESSKQPRTRGSTRTKSANERDAPLRHEVDEALLSRSNTKGTTVTGTDARKAWAADRSPLQKLEVKLNDISKEEKRARVQEAEQLLKERLANQTRDDVSQKPQTSVMTSQTKRLSLGQEDGRRGDGEQHSPRHVPGEMYAQIRQAGTKYPRAKRDSLNNKDMSTSDYGLQSPESPHEPQIVDQPRSRETPATNHSKSRLEETPGTPRLTKQPERGVRFENQGHLNGTDEGPASPIDLSINQVSLYTNKTQGVQLNNQPKAQSRPNSDRGSQIPKLARPSEKISEQRDPVYGRNNNNNNNNNIGQPSETTRRYDAALDPQQRKVRTSQRNALNREVDLDAIANTKAGRQTAVNYLGTETVIKPAQQEPHLSDIPSQKGKATNVDSGSMRSQDFNVRKGAGVARLALTDSSLQRTTSKEQKTWWEGGGSASRRRSGKFSNDSELPTGSLDGGTEPDNASASFNPPLYLTCGPLLRYTGLRRSRNSNQGGLGNASTPAERETWRGSVMIVTLDASSSYNPAPVLQIYKEPISPVPAQPQPNDEGSGMNSPPEYIDPVGGMPKLSRTGKMIYVKPVEDLEGGKDLSQLDDDEGLFEEFRTAAVPTSYGIPPRSPGRGGIGARGDQDGILSHGQSHTVQGVRLHAERGVTFWRFDLEVELGEKQERIGYRINKSASIGFWVPARGESMNVMFHSCNGFSMSVNPDDFSGPDPLWRDVLNTHQTRPFHVMIGGGDQIYNDAVMKKTTHFQDWLAIKNPHHKHEAEFSTQMREEVEVFYLKHYSEWFSQGLFGMANSQIPMVNVWDDHDIIDGFGSYRDHFMRAPVFSGIGAVAFKYYMLFQHQSMVGETQADEPSWLLGAAPGPYIKEYSRSIFMFLGRSIALLGLDCRTERRRVEVMSEASYRLVFDRCRREIVEGETKHLIVLLGVPIAYPRLVFLENILTSRVMDPIKALGRAGMFGGFLNQFDGGVEILDDLDDHWTAKNHKDERHWLIQELQELAAEKSVRVTILGGDVHLAAVGRFFSNPALHIPRDRDHRYMANIVSSAIVNTPPPEMMGDILNKRNKVHHLDAETDEDMIPMFTHDVDGKPRKNRRLLPRRNWCSIREYYPGSTPPPTPPPSEPASPVEDSPRSSNRLQRRFSLTKSDGRPSKPGGLLRRLSQRNQSSREYMPSQGNASDDSTVPYDVANDGVANDGVPAAAQKPPSPPQRPSAFHRRLTDMDDQTLEKGSGQDDNLLAGHVNLEYGLDIVLNCEISQKDPGGNTEPYRILIPALWYEGESDPNTLEHKKTPWLKMLGSKRRSKRMSGLARGQGRGEWGGGSLSGDSEGERPGAMGNGRPHTAISNRDSSFGSPRFSDSNVNKAERQVPQQQGNDAVLGGRIPPGQSRIDMLRGGDHPVAINPSPTDALLTGRIPPGQSRIDTLRGGNHPTAIKPSQTVSRSNAYDPARKQNEFEQISGAANVTPPLGGAPESGGNLVPPQRPSQTDRIMRANYTAGGEPEHMSEDNSEIEYEKPRTRNKIVRMLSGGKPSHDRRDDSPEYDSEIEYEKPRKQSKLARMLGAREPADDLSDDDSHYVQPRTRRPSTLERIMSSGGRKNEGSRYGDGQGGAQGSPSTPRGYSGIEAYHEKGWKRFF